MPEYVVKVSTPIILDREDLDRLEDVVYDVVVDEFKSPVGVDLEFVDGKFTNVGGIPDVEAVYN